MKKQRFNITFVWLWAALLLLASCSSYNWDPCPNDSTNTCLAQDENAPAGDYGGSPYVPFGFHAPWMADTYFTANGNYYGTSSGHGGSHYYCVDFNYGIGWDDYQYPLVAIADGVVVSDNGNGDGVYYSGDVKIEHDYGYTSVYVHNDYNVVEIGQEVRQGQVIGFVGNEGDSTGPHLHFCIYNENGQSVKASPMDGTQLEDGDAGSAVTSANNTMFQELTDYYGSALGGSTNSIHFYDSGNTRPASTSDVYIQDHDSSGTSGTTSAVFYDAFGGGRSAYLVHSGFWNHYSRQCGGPNGNCNQNGVVSCGPPITNEYGQGGGTARQDFKYCYLYWNGSSASAHSYAHVAPGWFQGGYWSSTYSYAFAQAFEYNGTRNDVGYAFDNGDGAGVHHWSNNSSLPMLQDFTGGSFGDCVIMHNDGINEAFVIRTGFWEMYRTLGPGTVGAPCEDEHDSGSVSSQEFENLTMYWDSSGGSYTSKSSSGCEGRASYGFGDSDVESGPGSDTHDDDDSTVPVQEIYCYDSIDNDLDGDIDCDDSDCTESTWCEEVDCDVDGDGRNSEDCGGTDCNDSDSDIYYGAPETCGNGVDEDCSGSDLVCSETNCTNSRDDDSDGYTDCDDPDCSSDSACASSTSSDYDGDGYDDDDDCGWWSTNIYPGAPELADWVDNDCDGSTDEGCSTDCACSYWSGCVDDFYYYYNGGSLTHVCTGAYIPPDYDGDGDGDSTDCAWWDATIYHGAAETADWNDNDCDGTTDEGCDGSCGGDYASGCSDDYQWWYLGTASSAPICY